MHIRTGLQNPLQVSPHSPPGSEKFTLVSFCFPHSVRAYEWLTQMETFTMWTSTFQYFFFLISKDSPSKINKEKLFPVNILLKTVILRTRHQCKGKISSKLQIYEHFPTGLLWKDVIVWVEKNHLCPSPHTKKNSYHWKCEVVCSVTWRKDDM